MAIQNTLTHRIVDFDKVVDSHLINNDRHLLTFNGIVLKLARMGATPPSLSASFACQRRRSLHSSSNEDDIA
ncbi:MAG: hypothetical protein QX199_17970 [Methylococcaceae bacterium]